VHLYRVSGLSVCSEIALPGLITTAERTGPADVTMRRQPVPVALAGAPEQGPTWQMEGDRFLLRIPGVVRFLLTGGREVAFELEGDTALDDAAVFLTGTAIGILLHQRGQMALHASAIAVNGKAVVFCGPSGSGKSTIAAALVQRGHALVTDDLCSIDVAGPPMVHSDGRQLKLWRQAIDELDLEATRGASVRRRLQKYYVESGATANRALPIGAVYVLREARPPHAPGIERPNVVDAALLLRRNAYRPRLVNCLDQKADYFRGAAAIADTAGIFTLTRELDYAGMAQVIGWLEEHWATIRLRPRAA
jgi:hypothetical protein